MADVGNEGSYRFHICIFIFENMFGKIFLTFHFVNLDNMKNILECHRFAKVCILELLKEKQAMRVHYELGVLRTLPILKIFQVPNKRFIFKVPILSQIYKQGTEFT